jgi:predicted amidohydrolase YtcJ
VLRELRREARPLAVLPVSHAFPTFRTPGPPDRLTGVIEHWVFWNDSRRWVEPTPLTADSTRVSLDGIGANDDFVWRVESGWSPAEHRGERVRVRREASPDACWEFTLLLPNKKAAENAAQAAKARGLPASSPTRLGRQYELTVRVNAWRLNDAELRRVERECRSLALQADGHYDGRFLDDPARDEPNAVIMEHALGFVDAADAAAAVADLTARGLRAEARPAGSRVVVVVTAPLPDRSEDELREQQEFDQVASRFDGRYEGSAVKTECLP